MRKTLRYVERVTEPSEIKDILMALSKHGLTFFMRIASMGLSGCRVLQVGEDDVLVLSRYMQKVKVRLRLTEIEVIEVESNCDIVAEDMDDGGRWDRVS